jgi:hypothetical protein
MSAAPSVVQKPQAGGVEFSAPKLEMQKYMEGLAELDSVLPKGVQRVIAGYSLELETQPRELFGRVEFRTNPATQMCTYFIAYDKVERLFRELMEIGKEFGCVNAVNEHIRKIAWTRYTFCEGYRDGVTFLTHEQSSHLHFWHFTIAYDARKDCVLMLDPRRLENRFPLAVRCDTRFNETRDLTLEQARAYAPQAEDVVRVNEQLAGLQIGFIHSSKEEELQEIFTKKLEHGAIKGQSVLQSPEEFGQLSRLKPEEARALAKPAWDVATINSRVEWFISEVETRDLDEFVHGSKSKAPDEATSLKSDSVDSVDISNRSVPRDLQEFHAQEARRGRILQGAQRDCNYLKVIALLLLTVLLGRFARNYFREEGPSL